MNIMGCQQIKDVMTVDVISSGGFLHPVCDYQSVFCQLEPVFGENQILFQGLQLIRRDLQLLFLMALKIHKSPEGLFQDFKHPYEQCKDVLVSGKMDDLYQLHTGCEQLNKSTVGPCNKP